MSDSLFTDFRREHRPLAHQLDQWSATAHHNCATAPRAELERRTDDELIDYVLEGWHRQTHAPLARVGPPHLSDEPIFAHRSNSDSHERHTVNVWRWPIRFTVQGNKSVLCTWPKAFGEPACGDSRDWLPIPEMYWELSDHGPVAFIDVPMESDPDGTAAPEDRYREAARYLDTAITAANDEIAAYDHVLREELAAILQERRGGWE